jgi:hypothetical protein
MARTNELRCPHCGWTEGEGVWDSWFRYLVDATLARRVDGVDYQGRLILDAEERVEIDDRPTAARLRCGDCNKEFALPAEVVAPKQIYW